MSQGTFVVEDFEVFYLTVREGHLVVLTASVFSMHEYDICFDIVSQFMRINLDALLSSEAKSLGFFYSRLDVKSADAFAGHSSEVH